MDKEEHKKHHIELHQALDLLAADMMLHTNRLLSETTILELMEWSHEQTIKTTEGSE